MTTKNIAIIGLGGVGGYFGFKINQANQQLNMNNHITFVARNETFKQVSKNGLTLLSPEHSENTTHPNEIVFEISELKNPDLVLICVKEYDLENVCQQLANVITPNTILLPMMNGADIYDRIRTKIPLNTILPSCVYVASHIKQKGIIEHKGNSGKLLFGKDSKNPSTDINWIIDLFKLSKINFECKENADVAIWTKFIFIASFGMITAKYNSSIGAVCTDKSQKEEAKEIMMEIQNIAFKKGIELPQNIIELTFKKAATFPPSTPTSLQIDLNSNKSNSELELFAGAIINYGKQTKTSTPNTQKQYQYLKSKLN
ncbi:ketopantoate reductase family protein [Tenacibaculum geojense]|uniref:2-dehydropantoate 2-reductase n=1 Tax=Tenacibaculum geojense TaxID=915352 RepID=A0ABW3JRB6_9FLAO